MDTPTDTPAETTVEITITDRCDECGAAAYVAAVFKTGNLAWCAHHGTERWDAINSQALVVIDHRWRLTEEPS